MLVYQSETSLIPSKIPSFTPQGLGLHDLHAGFNCLAFQSLGATTQGTKTLGNSPIFRPEETHKKHMQHAYQKENIKNGKHIDLGEGHQHFTKISGRDSLLATEQYDTGGFCVFLFGHCFLAFRKKIIGISLRPKGLTKKNSSKRNVFF